MTPVEIALMVDVFDSIDADDADDEPNGLHIEADGLLLDAVPPEIRAAYERLQARGGVWWYE
jgi:hypothetical protein